MSDPINYATGWYSISPAFALWHSSPHRVAEIKARREAARVVEENKQRKKVYRTRVQAKEGTIDIYA